MTRWQRSISGVSKLIDQYITDQAQGKEDLGWLTGEIAEILKRDEAWDGDNDFVEAVQEIETAETEAEFEDALVMLYEWADYNRIWIEMR